MRILLIGLVMAACTGVDARTLVLDGPPTLRTDRLGPVEGPKVLLSDGSIPEGLSLAATPADVVSIEGDQLTAVGPGQATIEATWQEQRVNWTLVVEPKISLRLVNPPATIEISQRRPLHLEARMGETAVDPGEVSWKSSDPEVLGVSPAGEVAGVAEGRAYVVVERNGAEAMAEIVVVSPQSP